MRSRARTFHGLRSRLARYLEALGTRCFKAASECAATRDPPTADIQDLRASLKYRKHPHSMVESDSSVLLVTLTMCYSARSLTRW